MADQEHYELIPVSPLRRLEKRIDRLETFSQEDPKSIFKDIIDIVKMNQQIVDELARSNDALRIELSKLPAKLDEVTSHLKELVLFIKASGEQENVGISQKALEPLLNKLDELVKGNRTALEKNDGMLEVLEQINKRMKGTAPQMGRQLLGLQRQMPPIQQRVAKPVGVR